MGTLGTRGGCRFSLRIVGLVVFVVPEPLLIVVDFVGSCVVPLRIVATTSI